MTAAERRLNAAKRRERVAELVAQRMPPHEIVVRLGIPLWQVRSDIQVVEQIWLKQTKDSLDIDKARQLARIDELEAQYRKAYIKSCQPKKRKRTLKKTRMVKVNDAGERIEVSDGGEKSTEIESKGAGDPRFLQGIEWCIMERNKIQGHYPRTDAPPPSMPVMVIVGPQSNVQVNTPPLPIEQKPIRLISSSVPVNVESLIPPSFTFDENAETA